MNSLDGRQRNPRHLRDALGQYATGVTVIATRGLDGRLAGLTANSFTSVSLDPPIVLWSLRKASRLYPIFQQAGCFIVNVLAAHQTDVARRTSSPVEDRFEGLHWTASAASNLPILQDCVAWFECRRHCSYDAGDHTMFLGEVLNFGFEDRPPLVFHGGRYIEPASGGTAMV